MLLKICAAVLHILLSWQSRVLASRNMYFASAHFINGEEMSRTSLPSLISCLGTCGSGCGAAEYFKQTRECVLFSEVLLLTDDAGVTSNGDGVMKYRKVTPLDSRYLVLYSGSIMKTWDEALAICQQFGSGLATIRNQQDFNSVNSSVTKLRVNEKLTNCTQRMWIGGRKEVDTWTWSTGELIEDPWPFWNANQPDHTGEACMRLVVIEDTPLRINDNSCANSFCAFVCE